MGEIRANPLNCGEYTECVEELVGSPFGKWTNKSCEFYKLFDIETNSCTEPYQATCGKMKFKNFSTLISDITFNILFIFVAVCINGERTSVSGECIYYNLCVNGLFIPQRCPKTQINQNGSPKWDNQMFDEESSQCVDKTKVAIPGKCESYKECIVVNSISPIEKWIESKCGANLHFDKSTNTCVDSSLSTCGKDLFNSNISSSMEYDC